MTPQNRYSEAGLTSQPFRTAVLLIAVDRVVR